MGSAIQIGRQKPPLCNVVKKKTSLVLHYSGVAVVVTWTEAGNVPTKAALQMLYVEGNAFDVFVRIPRLQVTIVFIIDYFHD